MLKLIDRQSNQDGKIVDIFFDIVTNVNNVHMRNSTGINKSSNIHESNWVNFSRRMKKKKIAHWEKSFEKWKYINENSMRLIEMSFDVEYTL